MKIKTVSILAGASVPLILAGSASAEPPPPPSGSEPAWVSLAPVPSVGGPGVGGVEGMSVACVGNKIIAAFGFDNFDDTQGTGDTSTTRIYDIASGIWTFGSPAPPAFPGDRGSAEGAGVAHGGLFYSVGGRICSVPRPDIMSYHPPTDTWTVLSPMTTARAGLAVAVVGNSIYAIGGRSGVAGPGTGAVLASVERYDIASDMWTPVMPLLSARSDLAAATVGGKIYVFGGIDALRVCIADVDVYDPVTDTWSPTPTDMPTPRAAFYAVETKGGTVYAIGGWGCFDFGLSVNESYKVAQDLWTVGLPPMPTPRAETGAVAHGGRIYIVGGGQPGFGFSVDAHEVFKP